MGLKALYQEYVVSLNAKTEQDLRDSFNFYFSHEKTMATDEETSQGYRVKWQQSQMNGSPIRPMLLLLHCAVYVTLRLPVYLVTSLWMIFQ